MGILSKIGGLFGTPESRLNKSKARLSSEFENTVNDAQAAISVVKEGLFGQDDSLFGAMNIDPNMADKSGITPYKKREIFQQLYGSEKSKFEGAVGYFNESINDIRNAINEDSSLISTFDFRTNQQYWDENTKAMVGKVINDKAEALMNFRVVAQSLVDYCGKLFGLFGFEAKQISVGNKGEPLLVNIIMNVYDISFSLFVVSVKTVRRIADLVPAANEDDKKRMLELIDEIELEKIEQKNVGSAEIEKPLTFSERVTKSYFSNYLEGGRQYQKLKIQQPALFETQEFSEVKPAPKQAEYDEFIDILAFNKAYKLFCKGADEIIAYGNSVRPKTQKGKIEIKELKLRFNYLLKEFKGFAESMGKLSKENTKLSATIPAYETRETMDQDTVKKIETLFARKDDKLTKMSDYAGPLARCAAEILAFSGTYIKKDSQSDLTTALGDVMFYANKLFENIDRQLGTHVSKEKVAYETEYNQIFEEQYNNVIQFRKAA